MTLWTLLRHLKRVHHWSSPPLWYPPPTKILFLPYIGNHRDTPQTVFSFFPLSLKSSNPGLVKTLQFQFRLVVTISHEYIFTDLMTIIHGMYTPHKATTRYHVSNRNILQVATTLKSTQELRGIPMVESYNQKHIFYGWEIISTFHRFEVMEILNGSFVKRMKEEYLSSQATMRWLKFCGTKVQYNLLPECNPPSTEMFLSEAHVGFHRRWKNTKTVVRQVIAKRVVRNKSEKKITSSRTKKHTLWEHQK